MRKAIVGVIIVVFDVILVKAWLAARAAAALGHGPAPSPVRYGVIIGFTALVLIALLTSGRRTSSSSRNGRNGGPRNGGSSYTWSGH